MAYCGGVEEIFLETKKNLSKIPGISKKIIDSLKDKSYFERAEKEISFLERNEIKPLFFLDKDYPTRLKQCGDSPLMLYYKGNVDLNQGKVVAVVGTRTPTDEGKDICNRFVEDLLPYNVLILSGLAYGIDTWSHHAAVKNNMQTVAVLGNGLDKIYPATNTRLARDMIKNGGLITEFLSGTKPDRQNFPMRNRIVAGMADAVVVVESKDSGGSMITANLAFGYNRDVFAFPGRPIDVNSLGCNNLIKSNTAQLINNAQDFVKAMGWKSVEANKNVQRALFVPLDDAEQVLFNILNDGESHGIDSLCIDSGFTMSKTSSVLLGMEFKGLLKTLPGKRYKLI